MMLMIVMNPDDDTSSERLIRTSRLRG